MARAPEHDAARARQRDRRAGRGAAAPSGPPRAAAPPAPRAAPGEAPRVWPGSPDPLGARYGTGPDGVEGTGFAVWAGEAEGVELCLFDEAGAETRLWLPECTDGVRHGFVPGIRPGQAYGFRAHGRWDPWTGARFNPAKLLLDPRARAVDGDFAATGPDGLPPASWYGHARDWPDREVADTVRDNRDSAPDLPRSIVVADPADPLVPDAERPGTAWADTVLYELHVRGFTMRHPDVPEALRGTYAGLAHPAVIEHLTGLGVTAVELLPVQQFAHEEHLVRRGLRNLWGYNTIGFFAPHAAYCSSGSRGEQVTEFRRMVRALHAAGLEVILDVVYNHTAEGGECGPTLSLRGLGNRAYYHLGDDRRRYDDHTGCGNTLDAGNPVALRLITDSLRYWVERMGVDGFRFDLASALTRTGGEPDMAAPFLAALAQDPVLRRVKLIAEPWDTGPDGYRAGAFPPGWSEWNDRFRDTVRDFWRGARPGLADVGYRLSGSSDLYDWGGRRPAASVNFVTAHDGFTLRDLVSYDHKHNEANGEDNRDGTDDNRSWNHGAEGESDDPAITALRTRQIRNLLATLLLAPGTPMLVAGDEMGRTQGGNNNAYCQDDATSWVDWSLLAQPRWRGVRDLTARLIALRREHPALRADAFFTGLPADPGGALRDLAWFTPDGREMTDEDWAAPAGTLAVFLSGADVARHDARGRRLTGAGFLLVLHAGETATGFTLPGPPWAAGYEPVLDTSREFTLAGDAPADLLPAGEETAVPPRSLLLLRAVPRA
ncbi:glycogen debranching protein GlgX [Streptantibioticus silvisoli]|uniref:glycogen debranching protein GlgX n=1 Tax=Streptantibioticus silvisoli TaxID=2705255 RepID=UPI0035567551